MSPYLQYSILKSNSNTYTLFSLLIVRYPPRVPASPIYISQLHHSLFSYGLVLTLYAQQKCIFCTFLLLMPLLLLDHDGSDCQKFVSIKSKRQNLIRFALQAEFEKSGRERKRGNDANKPSGSVGQKRIREKGRDRQLIASNCLEP